MIETDDFLADLEEHLREAARRRRPRLLAPAVAVATAAGLAAILALTRPHPATPPVAAPAPPDVQAIVARAIRDTAKLDPCRQQSLQRAFTDAPARPELLAALPALAAPPPAGDRVPRLNELTPGIGGAVLQDTAREIGLGRGLSVLVYVSDGRGGRPLVDPAACARARITRAGELTRHRSERVRDAARSALARRGDTQAGVQTLWTMYRQQDVRGASGAGTLIRPGHPLRPGLLASGGSGQDHGVYLGIAAPETTRVVVRGSGIEAPVREGFWGIRLRDGTGPLTLDELDAAGSVLRTIHIRKR